tara:strand:- start:2082 stop:2357 length:276 start_codon:yes stop_codon:yes gene_type:complete
MKTITVEYPYQQDIVVKTEAEAKAMGYKRAMVRHIPVNREYKIVVKQVSRLVQEEFMDAADYEAEMEEKCLKQTGLSRSAYQARYKRSWNE